MGDIADMILDGILDEQTGAYIGDENVRRYGVEAVGFPISPETREERYSKKVKCPSCGKRVKPKGLKMHMGAVHGDQDQ